MNIIVCVKQIPDPETPIEIDKENNWVKSQYYVVNPNDMLAVEQAVRIKENKGFRIYLCKDRCKIKSPLCLSS